MTWQEVIYDLLANDDDVTDLLDVDADGNPNIYPGSMEQDPVGVACIVYSLQSKTDPEQPLSGTNTLKRYVIDIEARATTNVEAEAILEAVENCLHGHSDRANGIDSIRLDSGNSQGNIKDNPYEKSFILWLNS